MLPIILAIVLIVPFLFTQFKARPASSGGSRQQNSHGGLMTLFVLGSLGICLYMYTQQGERAIGEAEPSGQQAPIELPVSESNENAPAEVPEKEILQNRVNDLAEQPVHNQLSVEEPPVKHNDVIYRNGMLYTLYDVRIGYTDQLAGHPRIVLNNQEFILLRKARSS